MFVVLLILSALAVVAAIGWLFMSIFALSIGSPGPSLVQTMAVLWPALVAVILACSAIMLGARDRVRLGLVVSMLALAVVPGAFWLLFGR